MPANTTTVSLRMNRELKSQAEELFSSLGLNMTTAMLLFLNQAVCYQGIPFEIRRPNAETVAAMREADDICKHPERYQAYDSWAQAKAEILAEIEVEDLSDEI